MEINTMTEEQPKTLKEKIRASTAAKRLKEENEAETLPAEQAQEQPFSYLHSSYALDKYTPEIGRDICTEVAEGKKSLTNICESHGVTRATFYAWMFRNSELLSNYMHARLSQADSMDDNIMETVADMKAKTIDPHAAKVAIDAYKWRAERLKPKVYGALSQVDKDAGASASAIGRMSVEDLQALRNRLIAPNAVVIDAELVGDKEPDSDNK